MSSACYIRPDDLPKAFPEVPARGRIKQHDADFEVDEVLGFELEGEGPHAWLRICKRDTNTQWLARQIARIARVRDSDVSYAGLKDRRAVATQWFSVRLDNRAEPDWKVSLPPGATLLESVRHRRKLRTGALSANRFSIRIVAIEGDAAAIVARSVQLAESGVPNYFGAQRFGRDGGNIEHAWRVLGGLERVRDRRLRGVYLSAARAMLFNRVLAHRVEASSWCRALAGESLMLEGSHSVFTRDDADADIPARLAALDIHPTGPLCGRGDSPARGEALNLEESVLAECAPWQAALAEAGVAHARRALRVVPRELSVVAEGDSARVALSLPAGAYATVVLRELAQVSESA